MARRKRYKAFTFTPSQGGMLMASISKDTVGIKNYTTKRDFRRRLDREQRREGYDYFTPKDYLFTNQYSQAPVWTVSPNLTSEINLIHMARRPNGDKAIIVGTTTGYLLRYEGKDEVRYFNDVRDSDFIDNPAPVDGDKNFDDVYVQITFGSELVSGNYSAGIKNITVVAGGEYYFKKGQVETSLVNGGETLTASGFFKAQGTSVVLNGLGGQACTASIKKRTTTSDYSQSIPEEWRIIYTPDSNSVGRKRWEAVNINGYTVFNNGADLPLVYRVEWDKVKPIYALREAGVARVGSIAELNGVLVCGDVSQIKANVLDGHMKKTDPYGYYSGGVDRIGYRVLFSDLDDPTSFGATAKATIFKSARVMAWSWNPKSMENNEVTIVGAGAGGGNLTANIVGRYTKTQTAVKVQAPRLSIEYNDGEYFKGVKLKDTDEKEFEGITVEALGAALEKGEIILFDNGSALELSENIPSGATVIYGTLLGSIDNNEKGKAAQYYVKLDEIAQTSINETEVARADAFSSTAGFDDLQDDGSPIMKMVKLQNVLVIYKETSIFIAEFTGNTDAPFRFNFVKIPAAKCLKYRHTVVNVEGMAHIYAGATSFYSFDLASRKPKEIINFKNADTLFFDNAAIDNTESIFAADNQLTKEIWFITNVGTSSDKALCYDYIFKTLSTTSINVTAANTVDKPGSSEDWFIMGNSSGILLLYGLTNETNTRWSGDNYFARRGSTTYSASSENYDSILESGAEDFGDSFGEKDLRSYVLHLSHTSDSPSTRLDIFGYHNVGDVVFGSASENLLDTRVYDDPDTKNLFPLFYKQHYFQDRIQVSTGNLQYAGKTYEVAGVDSRSFVRTDDA